jgi:hypothetical protein
MRPIVGGRVRQGDLRAIGRLGSKQAGDKAAAVRLNLYPN